MTNRTQAETDRRVPAPTPPTPAPPAPAEVDPSRLGLIGFLHGNETLIKMLSLLLAGAGFLRASPKDDAIAVLIFLIVIMGLAIYVRLWQGLPRRLGILPGPNWKPELIVFYYCGTVSLVIAVGYLTWGYLVALRDEYLWVALSTLFGLASLTWLTYRADAVLFKRVLVSSASKLNRRGYGRLGSVILGLLLVLSLLASYYLARVMSPPINNWLDQVLPGLPAGPPPS